MKGKSRSWSGIFLYKKMHDRPIGDRIFLSQNGAQSGSRQQSGRFLITSLFNTI